MGQHVIIAGTGHRPDKLGGWGDTFASFTVPKMVAVEAMDSVVGVVSGGAAGWDLALAHAALDLGVPLYMAIPFEGQESKWNKFWKEKYNEARSNATKEIVLNDGYSREALLGRNQWMVDYIADKGGYVLALWNGSHGGTMHCVNRARKAGVPVSNCWDAYLEKLAFEQEVRRLEGKRDRYVA